MNSCSFCDGSTDSQADGIRVVLSFSSGRAYLVSENLPHMILDHAYQPIAALVGDVMNSRFIPYDLSPNPGEPIPIMVEEYYSRGAVPLSVPYRLMEFIKIAKERTPEQLREER